MTATMTVRLNITRIRQVMAIPVDEGWVIAEKVLTATTTSVQEEVQASEQVV